MSLLLLDTPTTGLFPPESGRLHIDGKTFRTEDDALWQWRGYSWFLGFLRYCRGEDVTPDLRWMRAQGFNIPRIFGPLPWKETQDYRIESFDFTKLDAFLTLLESHGLRSNWSLGHYKHPGLRAFAQLFYDIASTHWSVVTELTNEPHVGASKPDPIADFLGVDRHGILTAYGYYKEALDGVPGSPPVLDFGTVHTPRDAAWHRKARIAQEVQHATGKPWISDEPAKLTEPGFIYPGGKNDPVKTPAEMVWHAAVCELWTAGCTFHCEEGKWGRTPTAGMLQATVAQWVRDHVFTKIDASWQTGGYMGSHLSASPVNHIQDVWSYSSMHPNKALSVRCAFSAPQSKAPWTVTERWGPAGSLVTLTR